MKSTAPVVTTLAILFALAAPMHARAAIGPAMGGYSAAQFLKASNLPATAGSTTETSTCRRAQAIVSGSSVL